METNKQNHPHYEEVINFFGSPSEAAKHFDIDIRAVYQWKDKVPVARYREFQLLRSIDQQTS